MHRFPGSFIMQVQMFYLPDLIISLVSSAVTHFPWNATCVYHLIWHCPLCLPAGCQQESWRWQTLLGGMCLSVFVRAWRWKRFWMVPSHNAHLDMHVSLCLHEKVSMCVTGADSYVRGEVAPSLLSLGVCRGLCHLSKLYQQAYSHPAP